jgi:hypothetical protein
MLTFTYDINKRTITAVMGNVPRKKKPPEAAVTTPEAEASGGLAPECGSLLF